MSDHPTAPLYEHDCESCIHLGRYDNAYGAHDLYFHPGDNPTVVARRSSEGSDYSSGLDSNQASLIEAMRRALRYRPTPIDFEGVSGNHNRVFEVDPVSVNDLITPLWVAAGLGNEMYDEDLDAISHEVAKLLSKRIADVEPRR